MNSKNKVISIMICIVIIIIVISIITLIILKFQMEDNATDSEGNYADEYGDYPDYGESEAQNNIIIESEEEIQQYPEENYYKKVSVSDQEMSENYFIDYRDNRLYFPEEAYNSLDETYRNRRFSSFDEYKEYLEKNRITIASSGLRQYSVSEENGKKVYTCVDQNNNYYTFIEDAVMQYTVKEGKYNPEPEGFVEEYENSLDETKVMRNINRFIAMVNNKEYDTAYKVLETNFKENYFPTEEEFADYISNNFFADNNVEFNSMPEEIDGVYTVEVALIDREDEDGNTMTYIFEVTLLEGTDYTISFNIE